MKLEEEDEVVKPKVAMLLDIDHFYGESEGRMGPTLIFLAFVFGPVLLYAYFQLFLIIPVKYVVPVWLFHAVRCWCIILGDEKSRLDEFVKKLDDVYENIHDMLRLKAIHNDNCIEYINGTIAYMVVAYNRTSDDNVHRSILVKKFQSQLIGEHDFDLFIQNIVDISSIENKYSQVKLFPDQEAARDYIDIMDHNREIVRNSTLLTRTIYLIKCRRSEWKETQESIEAALRSNYARAYKLVYLANSREEIEQILSRDTDGVINLNDMLRQKYCTKDYHGSYVAGYDDSEVADKEDTEKEDSTFHTTFEE